MLFDQSSRIIIGSLRSGAKVPPSDYVRIRVDRTTILGNPFHIENGCNRESCIAKHRKWLKKQIKERTEVYDELQKLYRLVRVRPFWVDRKKRPWCGQSRD